MNLERILIPLGSFLDRKIGWPHLPRPLGIVTLVGLREQLREQNLYDTGLVEPAPPEPPNVDVRTLDGSWDDEHLPAMGSLGTRFGRNVPIDRTYPEPEPELLEPSPRLVSRKLLTRREGHFIPADSINLLAAAWIQFEVHDWVSHETDPTHPITVPLADDDDWPAKPMKIPRTKPLSAGEGKPPVYTTDDTHWWDGSQIYGYDVGDFQAKARTFQDGKLAVGADGLHPADLDPFLDPVGPRGNLWVGLALMHSLFIREHNEICEALLSHEGSGWSDEQLYGTARLVNAAVMAKIHTIEWTSAVAAHPTTELGANVNWYGILGKGLRSLGRIGQGDFLSGIPGSPTNHFGVPYSLTEEFVSVYRMHPLIPDDYLFWSLNGGEAKPYTFREIGPGQWRDRFEDFSITDAFYSFGIAHPGALVLHNYPTSLIKDFDPDHNNVLVDLATVDVLRDRERGVPRYNEFRALMHREPVASFEELTGDPATASELRDVYGHIDRVDLMVGLYAEARPRGLAFCDTTFRVFLLMASRRLKSDRFFTVDYTPEVYTQTGLDWIDRATMSKVLERHHPELAPLIRPGNAFKPWQGPNTA
jgi:Animal haem peroxidase